jgi:hypothetical protein
VVVVALVRWAVGGTWIDAVVVAAAVVVASAETFV